MDDSCDVRELEIKSIIGFDGNTINGFKVHPDGQHVVFALGNKVSIQHWTTKKQCFLCGHTNTISTMDVSRTGKYIASGQINHIGFRAMVIIWDFDKRAMLTKHEVHKVRVESITFSRGDRFVMSLGGRDCGNVVVWDVQAAEAVCGSVASPGTAGDATTICATEIRSECFVTGGDRTLRIWTIDAYARAMNSVEVNVSKLKRVILCIVMDERDELAYCGTSTGDVFKVRLNFHHDPEILAPIKQPMMIGCYGKVSQKKNQNVDQNVECYSMGVRSLLLLSDRRLLIGAGDGVIDLVKEMTSGSDPTEKIGLKVPSLPRLKSLQSTNVGAMVTSLQMLNKQTILVGTTNCEIFSINLDDFSIMKLLVTCHLSTIYDIAFPHNFSEVFATAGKDDVRVWSLSSTLELLRIRVPNFSCSSVQFTYDGTAILTGWNDGIIRAFTPLTGRLMYAILNAHNKGVSALNVTRDGNRVVSGGCEGQVRVWDLSTPNKDLICKLKEHKGPVSAVHVNKFDNEAVSASTDGSCIIWDLVRMCRKQILIRNALFMCVKYFPSAVQILTGGSDRKVAYWEVFDGSLIRELEASISGAINALDLSPDGSMFVTGGNDQIVKLWKYQEGVTTHVGLGHSAVITAMCFSPDGKYIVSSSSAGSIFVWKCPFELVHESTDGDNTKNVETSQEHINEIETARSKNSDKVTKEKAQGDAPCNVCCAQICQCNIESARSAHSEGSKKSTKSNSK